MEWAQTPTRVDSNTLKVGTNNTNRDTNRVALESLPSSSLTLFFRRIHCLIGSIESKYIIKVIKVKTFGI